MGDSKSLEGGTLLVTPLLGADGNVYAVAQGSLSIGGFQAEGQAAKITRGVPTVGRLPNGAIIEREIEFSLNNVNQLRLALRNADFTTAKRIAIAINDYIGAPVAEPLDPSTVQLTLPKKFPQNVVAMLTEIEQLQVEPDEVAKVVIDERSGVIVIGRDVRVSTVAVAQGNLTVTISEAPQVSQPAPFSQGRTVVTPRSQVGVQEEGKRLALVQEGVSLQQIVDGLERARHRAARSDHDPAGDQGRRRHPGRHPGDVMTSSASTVDIGASLSSIGDASNAQAQDRAQDQRQDQGAAENFESMFLSNMFQEMFAGVDGDGPMGGSGALESVALLRHRPICQEFRQGRRHRHRAQGL